MTVPLRQSSNGAIRRGRDQPASPSCVCLPKDLAPLGRTGSDRVRGCDHPIAPVLQRRDQRVDLPAHPGVAETQVRALGMRTAHGEHDSPAHERQFLVGAERVAGTASSHRPPRASLLPRTNSWEWMRWFDPASGISSPCWLPTGWTRAKLRWFLTARMARCSGVRWPMWVPISLLIVYSHLRMETKIRPS